MNILEFLLISYQSVLLQSNILCIISNCKDSSLVYLKHRHGRRKISCHSSSDITPGEIDSHFCMPAGFTYLVFVTSAERRRLCFHFCWFVSLSVWLVGWLIGWLVDWLVGWSVDWLVVSSIAGQRMDGILWNFQDMLATIHRSIWKN